ncbi:metallophosphoesterase family protein [Falsiroseomonas sp. HC035]|uniref:metallophosphoesterase family protein n=1 Tax=Falsiroseomonas sp. HC035 TaxID=3390999 RepID=UPI003D318143
MTRRIAHLSDLHFGAEDPAVVAALAQEVAEWAPDLIAVSGDLTQGARHDEFIAAMDFLRALPAPLLVVPGNHDMSPYNLVERFSDPYRRWRRHVQEATEPVFEDAEIAVVGMNTARRGGLYLNWARGRVSGSRLAIAEGRLAALPPGLFRIVVAHHPFLAPQLNPGARLVGNSEPALAAFARHDVRLVLTGHLHLGDVRPVREGGLVVAQSGSATSVRLRGTPNAYNRILVEDGRARIIPRIWHGAGWEDLPSAA